MFLFSPANSLRALARLAGQPATMRFKASVIPSRFPSFWSHIQLMERVGKRAVLVFERSSVRMLVTSDSDTVMQYSHLSTPDVFDAFRCESRTDNVIAIEVSVANLLAGLRPAAASSGGPGAGGSSGGGGGGGEQLTLKLTKRDEAQYLRAETRPRSGERTSLLVQDIPVRVIVGQEMLRYAPPSLPPSRVCIFLPAPRVLCAVVDRMKALGKTLLIEAAAPAAAAGQGGGAAAAAAPGARLTLGVDHELGRVRSVFADLTCEPQGDTSARAAVSLADFSRTLRGVAAVAQAVPLRVKLALLPPTALFLNVALEDGTGSMAIIHTLKDLGGVGEEEEEEEGGGGGGGGAEAGGGEGGDGAGGEGGGEGGKEEGY